MGTIVDNVLQETPSTEDDEIDRKIQNVAVQMKKAMRILPEVIDGAKTLVVDFSKEVNVSESQKTIKNYKLIVTYSLFENVKPADKKPNQLM